NREVFLQQKIKDEKSQGLCHCANKAQNIKNDRRRKPKYRKKDGKEHSKIQKKKKGFQFLGIENNSLFLKKIKQHAQKCQNKPTVVLKMKVEINRGFIPNGFRSQGCHHSANCPRANAGKDEV